MEKLKEELAKVIVWLKSHGEDRMDGMNYRFACKDEPYMDFTAEWQEWDDNKEVLYIGYHFEQNGDICHDPQFAFMLEDDRVTRISMMTAYGQSHHVKSPDDLDYARKFVRMAYKRHMEGRGVIELEAKEEESLEGGRSLGERE